MSISPKMAQELGLEKLLEILGHSLLVIYSQVIHLQDSQIEQKGCRIASMPPPGLKPGDAHNHDHVSFTICPNQKAGNNFPHSILFAFRCGA